MKACQENHATGNEGQQILRGILAIMALPKKPLLSPFCSELEAILLACKLIVELQIYVAVVETDCFQAAMFLKEYWWMRFRSILFI